MPFLSAEILNFQGSAHLIGVGSLSNIKEITFDQAWKASGLSSNMNDYFDVEDAKFVAMK